MQKVFQTDQSIDDIVMIKVRREETNYRNDFFDDKVTFFIDHDKLLTSWSQRACFVSRKTDEDIYVFSDLFVSFTWYLEWLLTTLQYAVDWSINPCPSVLSSIKCHQFPLKPLSLYLVGLQIEPRTMTLPASLNFVISIKNFYCFSNEDSHVLLQSVMYY